MRSHELHETELRLPDRTLRHTSLFPLLDARGRVHRLLIVEPGGLWFLPTHRRQAVQRLARGIRIETPATLTPAEATTPEQQASGLGLGGLIHFDPWSVLEREPWVSHPAAPEIRATNRVPARIGHVIYDRHLRRALGLLGVAGSSLPLRDLVRSGPVARKRGPRARRWLARSGVAAEL